MPRASTVACALALTSCAAAEQNYSMYCRYKCGDSYKSSCHETKCPPAEAPCSFFASQPFYGGPVSQLHEICREYDASAPECDGTTKQCKEADSFQLICDRQNDLSRDVKNHDWHGVARVFHENAMVFSPGGAAFMRAAEVAAAFEAHAKSAGLPYDLKQILTQGGHLSSAKVLHAVGAATLDAPMPSYTRWEKNVNGHWVVESMIMQGLAATASAASNSADDDVFAAISRRSAEFSDLYNSKNYAGVTGIYADSAVFVPRDGRRLVPKAALEEFLAQRPIGEGAKLSSKIVSRGPSGDVAHEIGFSDTTQAGYYTRWVSHNSTWQIDVHCFAVFPKVGAVVVV